MSKWYEILADKAVFELETRDATLLKYGLSRAQFFDLLVLEMENDNHLLVSALASLYAYFITETDISAEQLMRLSRIVSPSSEYEIPIKVAAYICMYAANQSVAGIVVDRTEAFAYLCMVVRLVLLSGGISGPQMLITMLLHSKDNEAFLHLVMVIEIVRQSINKPMKDVYLVPPIKESIILIGQIVACILLVRIGDEDRPKLQRISRGKLSDDTKLGINDIKELLENKSLKDESLAVIAEVVEYLESMITDEFAESIDNDMPSDIDELRKNIQ